MSNLQATRTNFTSAQSCKKIKTTVISEVAINTKIETMTVFEMDSMYSPLLTEVKNSCQFKKMTANGIIPPKITLHS